MHVKGKVHTCQVPQSCRGTPGFDDNPPVSQGVAMFSRQTDIHDQLFKKTINEIYQLPQKFIVILFRRFSFSVKYKF